MPLTLADIKRLDIQSIRDVADGLANTATAWDTIKSGFKKLPHVGNWSGSAADAANQDIDGLGKYLGENASARQEAAGQMKEAADEFEGIKELLDKTEADAIHDGFSVDLNTGTVTPQREDYKQSDLDHYTTTFKQILSAGDTADADLAHAVNLTDGTDRPGDPPTIPTDLNSERARTETAAFTQVYGRAPASANDWRMAAALDPHSYSPKDGGVPPQVVAGRFTPQPGKGVVRTNLFIPTDKVNNTFKDGTDIAKGRLMPQNFGDNRGPSASADPEASRVSVFVDYDNGVVVTRQNPTVNVDGQRDGALAGVPEVHVVQAPDGRMTIDYNAKDAYEFPLAAAAGVTVNGRVTLVPHADGTVGIGGNTTIYPSMETYQYRDGHPPAQIQWNPANSGSEWGPGTSLERHHWVGDSTISAVRPDMPGWEWELENLNPFGGDPFIEHTTQLTDPAKGALPTIGSGR